MIEIGMTILMVFLLLIVLNFIFSSSDVEYPNYGDTTCNHNYGITYEKGFGAQEGTFCSNCGLPIEDE